MNKYFNIKKNILVEPDLENINILSKNLQTNNIAKYTLVNKALYSSNKRVKFDTTLNYNARKISTSGKILVRTINLINLFKKYHLSYVDLLKIDIEGAEWKLISKENKKYFTRCKIIIIEYHLDKYYKDIKIFENYFRKYIIFVDKKNDHQGLIYIINPYNKILRNISFH